MSQEKLDLRLAPAALSAWGAAAVGVGWSPSHAVVGALALLGASALALLVRSRRATPPTGGTGSSGRLVAAVAVMVAAGALGVSGLRAGAIQAGPVPDLARDRAHVEVSAVVDSDPRLREGKFAPYVVVRVNARKVTGRGETTRVRSPLLVIGDRSWMSVHVGDHVQADGRLQVAQGPDLSGVLMGHDAPQVTAPAGLVDRVVGRVRAGLVEAAQPLPAAEQALVPALVDGDDSTMPEQVADDFRTTGLTHLLAVSGSNLTLVLGFVLFVARWCGVRAYGLRVVGLCAVVFFVLLARPEPSVLRAAAMGVVALAGMSAGGRRRGIRALCVAVVVLVLLDPWLARSVGFLLSSLATAGILVLAPRWRAAMSRWMPAILAEAVAVPLAAQLACIPVIAAFSGRVSLVAVLANLLAAPAVGPTTVLGLVAGLLATASAALGHLCGYLAGVPAWWIIWVAQHAAGLEGASMTWPVGVPAIAGLTILCLAIVLLLPRVLRHRSASLCVVSLLVLAVLHP
ncbi:MAG: ComEC/Rec2 family competence protein, partial [Nocardioidaceae bacterium]